MPRMTTAEAVIETLLTHGIDTLFALPGVHNDHLFDALHFVPAKVYDLTYTTFFAQLVRSLESLHRSC